MMLSVRSRKTVEKMAVTRSLHVRIYILSCTRSSFSSAWQLGFSRREMPSLVRRECGAWRSLFRRAWTWFCGEVGRQR